MTVQNTQATSVFGLENEPAWYPMMVANEQGPYVPAIDPGYEFQKDLVRDVMAWLKNETKDGLYISGPTGCGKTTGIVQIFARLKRPVIQYTCNRRTEVQDLIGHHTLSKDGMVFQYGPASIAKKLGIPLLMNEIDLIPPEQNAGMNFLCDGSPIVIAENGGEVIHGAPGYQLIATANTAGIGDETGLFQGTLRQNMAFLDRFWSLEMGYPERDTEIRLVEKALENYPDAVERKRVAEKMVDVANDIRDVFMGKSDSNAALEWTMSTRTLLRWAHLTLLFKGAPEGSFNYAIKRALTNKCTNETKESIHGIVQRHLGA